MSNRLLPGRLPEWLLKFLKNCSLRMFALARLFVTVPDSGHLREGFLPIESFVQFPKSQRDGVS